MAKMSLSHLLWLWRGLRLWFQRLVVPPKSRLYTWQCDTKEVNFELITIEAKVGGQMEDFVLVKSIIVDQAFSYPQRVAKLVVMYEARREGRAGQPRAG